MEEQAPHDEKLTLILRTAAVIFAEKGYHQASIRDISRATGISLSGLYYYVPSKEEILFRIQEHAFRTVVENLERRLRGVADPEERLRLFIENHLRFFVANMKEMKVLSHEATALSGELRERVAAVKRCYTDVCSGILGALRPDADAAELRVATFSLFGMMNWIYNWYHPGRDVPVDALAAEMTRIFMRGYLAGTAEPVARPVGGAAEMESTLWR
ncbi:MAG TPA: TetR/AcrR family transcriptional regulator [Longimicrobiales bacterium]|nr:TetR/AcrR family transcriptional regulator [Longimicrobiales bacterium]